MSPTRRRSLFWPIAGLFLLTAVVGTVLQWILVMAILQPLETRESRARAELVANGVAADIAASGRAPDADTLQALVARQRERHGPRSGWVAWRSADGTVLTDPPDRAAAFGPLLGGVGPATTPRPRGRVELVARRPVELTDGGRGEVFVARPVRSRNPLGMLASPTSLLFLPVALLASTVAGLIVVRVLVRRLRALEELARRVAEGDLDVRIADQSGDEIGRLAGQLDNMTERLAGARDQLERQERQRRQLFADITHELATPLTSIRGYAETMLDPAVAVSETERQRYVHGTLEEARRLDRLIRDLFELARLEAGATPLQREPLDLAALARHTVERFAPRFRDAGLTLDWHAANPEAWIEADGLRIEQALDNLLVNALRYVPRGGRVAIGLDRAEAAGPIRLTVSDDGPGIDDAELPHVFERFYRGASARGTGEEAGSGLGLAIVREIVTRHGGTVRAARNASRGLTIAIELPART